MSNYATVSEANDYISTHYVSTDPLRIKWESLDEADKEIYLTLSTEAINSLPWPGRKKDISQENAFPRINQKEVPKSIIYACIENTIMLSDEKVTEEINTYRKLKMQGISSYTIGNLSESFFSSNSYNSNDLFYVNSGIISSKAQQFLKPFMGGGYIIE